MVTFENFKETIETYQEFLDKQDKLREAGIDILESWLNDLPAKLFNQWCLSNFTEVGADWIFWWLFEDVDKIIYFETDTLFGHQSVELDVTDIEALYNYLKSCKYAY